MLKRRRKIKIKNKKALIIVLLIALVASYFLPDKFSASKYVLNKIQNYFFKSEEFYFESDKLREDGLEVEETNTWSGTEAYNLIISMYSKKNEDQYSSYDIKYDVSVECTSSKVECKLKNNSTEQKGRTIKFENDNKDAFTVIVTPTEPLNNGESVEVKITATSTGPYKKTLTGTITLTVGRGEVYYEIIDEANSPYLDLVLINPTLEAKNVTIEFNTENMVIDNTNEAYINEETIKVTETKDNYTYIKGLKLSIGSLENILIRFYKTDKSQVYSSENAKEIISVQ